MHAAAIHDLDWAPAAGRKLPQRPIRPIDLAGSEEYWPHPQNRESSRNVSSPLRSFGVFPDVPRDHDNVES